MPTFRIGRFLRIDLADPAKGPDVITENDEPEYEIRDNHGITREETDAAMRAMITLLLKRFNPGWTIRQLYDSFVAKPTPPPPRREDAWTRRPPEKDGIYWWRRSQGNDVSLFRVAIGNVQVRVYHLNGTDLGAAEKGDWYGPVLPGLARSGPAIEDEQKGGA